MARLRRAQIRFERIPACGKTAQTGFPSRIRRFSSARVFAKTNAASEKPDLQANPAEEKRLRKKLDSAILNIIYFPLGERLDLYMKENTVAAPERVIAAVLFLLAGIGVLVLGLSNTLSFWSVLQMLSFLAVAVILFKRDRGQNATYVLGFLALVMAILFFRGFFVHAYSRVSYNYRTYDMEYRFSFLAFLGAVVRLCAYLLLALLAAANFMNVYDKKVNRFWYMPALLMAVSSLLSSTYYDSVGDLIFTVPLIPAFLFAALWIIGEEPEGCYPVGKHIAMTLVTLGLWYLVWVWHITRRLNNVNNMETRRPTVSLLLCLFLPLYAVYWNYASAQRIDRLARQNGVESKLDVLCLVLGLLIPFLPSIVMQDKLNRITQVSEGVFAPDFPVEPKDAPQTESLPEM